MNSVSWLIQWFLEEDPVRQTSTSVDRRTQQQTWEKVLWFSVIKPYIQSVSLHPLSSHPTTFICSLCLRFLSIVYFRSLCACFLFLSTHLLSLWHHLLTSYFSFFSFLLPSYFRHPSLLVTCAHTACILNPVYGPFRGAGTRQRHPYTLLQADEWMKIVDRMALLNSATGKVGMEYTPARLFIYSFGFGKATSIIFFEEALHPLSIRSRISRHQVFI